MIYKTLLNKAIGYRTICTTNSCNLIQKWRKERGLPLNPNTGSILTEKPDFTYLDGRPSPLLAGQKKRIVKQEEIAQKIIELSAEIDFAMERHNQILLNEKQHRENIIKNKLKPKGDLVLAKGKKK